MDSPKDLSIGAGRRTTRSMTAINGQAASLTPHAWQDDVRKTTRKTKSACSRNESSRVDSKAIVKVKTKPGQSRHSAPAKDATSFGLIQESIAHNLYHLCIQAMLWNQTSGKQARPVFYQLIELYPTPEHLSRANLPELTALLQPLGLHNIRAKRCILFAERWLEVPPVAGRTHIRKGYPIPGGEEGFEIAHLPGMGPYAIDSFRIFHRDEMRGVASDWLGGSAGDVFEPEWTRVVPLDKELKAYVKWRWSKTEA